MELHGCPLVHSVDTSIPAKVAPMQTILFRSALLSMAVFGCAMATPALAQDNAGDKVKQVIVYGEDPCQAGEGDEIVVCARMPESDRYRIPEMFRSDPNKPVEQAWTNRVESLERAGAFGTDSCSPAGMGGFTGCTQKLIRNAYAEKRQQDNVDWAKLTADERKKRNAQIDAEAEAVEARVKAIEEQEKARKAAEAAETTPQN